MRRVLYILLVINILFLPLGLGGVVGIGLHLFHFKNFELVPFSIENRTSATIYVTPVGTLGKEGHKALLFTAQTDNMWIPSGPRGDFQIKPGEILSLYYAWSDIQFSEILVRKPNGELRAFIVEPDPTVNQYHVPTDTSFEIDDLATLAPMTAELERVYTKIHQQNNAWRRFILLITPLFSLMVILFLLTKLPYRTHRSSSSTSTP